jgi:hypothetical protein
MIPSSSLVFQEHGAQVAVITDDDRVHFKPINIVRIIEGRIEISGGVSAKDRIVNNPSAALLEGDKVRIVQPTNGYEINPEDLN